MKKKFRKVIFDPTPTTLVVTSKDFWSTINRLEDINERYKVLLTGTINFKLKGVQRLLAVTEKEVMALNNKFVYLELDGVQYRLFKDIVAGTGHLGLEEIRQASVVNIVHDSYAQLA